MQMTWNDYTVTGTVDEIWELIVMRIVKSKAERREE